MSQYSKNLHRAIKSSAIAFRQSGINANGPVYDLYANDNLVCSNLSMDEVISKINEIEESEESEGVNG